MCQRLPLSYPTGGIDERGATLDVREFKDPLICFQFGLEQSLDGMTWEAGGGVGSCGQQDGVKTNRGIPSLRLASP
jgi:hypothetical protein